MKPQVLLDRLQSANAAGEGMARACVNLAALGVETHALIMAKLPISRRTEAIAALKQHPIVLGCDHFASEPMDVILEVAAGNGHNIQGLITWAQESCGMYVHDILPIEKVLHGGPTQVPRLDG